LGLGALVAATTAGCLPRGAPPGGRQVVADRKATLEAIVPPNGDGVLRILVLKPGAVADSQDLYLLSVDDADQPPSEQLVLSGVNSQDGFGCIDRVAPCGSISRDGALWVGGNSGLVRVNPYTGAQIPVRSFPVISPSGDRFFIRDQNRSTLYQSDGSAVELDLEPGYGPAYFGFFGEDFYYVTPQGELMRLPPSGVPEQLATGVEGFSGTPTPDGTLLILIRATSDPSVQAYSFRDPLTGAETALPFSGFPSVSPGGQWLVDTDTSSGGLTFFNFRSGAQSVVAIPGLDPSSFVFPTWRPGSSQVWFTIESEYTPTVWIFSPDESPISVPGVRLVPVGKTGFEWQQNVFTADGAHWFSTASGPDVTTPVIQVGRTDDPTAPRFELLPQGTSLFNAWLLADGRLLTAVYTDSMPRSDVFATNLDTGERVQLAERGRVAAVGDTRLVGMFHFDPNYRGDLTTVELASGQQTILAPEFAVTAFVEPQGTDLVPPGARVVYQFQARTDSPYDGIWVVNSP
jgi:hypothetical protein